MGCTSQALTGSETDMTEITRKVKRSAVVGSGNKLLKFLQQYGVPLEEVELETEDDYGNFVPVAIAWTPETPEEAAARAAAEAKNAEYRLQLERAKYEELRKKFGDK